MKIIATFSQRAMEKKGMDGFKEEWVRVTTGKEEHGLRRAATSKEGLVGLMGEPTRTFRRRHKGRKRSLDPGELDLKEGRKRSDLRKVDKDGDDVFPSVHAVMNARIESTLWERRPLSSGKEREMCVTVLRKSEGI